MATVNKPTIQIITQPSPKVEMHPCLRGDHRWAWLIAGGQACGYCGRRR